ncbi:MAG TPA: hypothetical protein VF765_04655 [Polyangiaceae bacterium]
MKDPHVEPLDPELAALLDSERHAGADPSALDRVWKRVVLPLPASGAAASGSGLHRSWLASHAVGVAAASFVVGGITGAGIYAAVQKPAPEHIVYVERPAPVAASVPAMSTENPTAPPPADSGSSAARASSSARPSQSAPASTLSAERALLDQARAALTSGDGAKALSIAEEHRRRFPSAQLDEEREAIAIQALVAIGRYDEARARAARFRESAPNSLFLPAIEASVASIP